MGWTKRDDLVTEHPKVLALISHPQGGYEGYFRWDQLLGWCSRHHTGGSFTTGAAHQLGVRDRHLTALLDVGLVERNGNGLAIHDYGDYNPAGTDAERARRYRARKRDGGVTDA